MYVIMVLEGVCPVSADILLFLLKSLGIMKYNVSLVANLEKYKLCLCLAFVTDTDAK